MKTTLHVSDITHAAQTAEQTGQYESGLQELIAFWDYRQPEIQPDLSSLSKAEGYELLLRAGALYGFYASSQNDSQKISKNLLTQAYFGFEELKYAAANHELSVYAELKRRECAVYLAKTSSRMDSSLNTESWLDVAYAVEIPDTIFLHALIVEAIIKINAGFDLEAADRLSHHAREFSNCRDLYIRANFHSNLGVALKNLDRSADSIRHLREARIIFEELRHLPYLASTENNIGRLYQRAGEFELALSFYQKALKVAELTGDHQKIGGIHDSLAQVIYEMGGYPLALKHAEIAIEFLSKTEFHAYLIEAFETKIKCLVKMNRLQDASNVFGEAYRFATTEQLFDIRNRLNFVFASVISEISIIRVEHQGDITDFLQDFSVTYSEDFHFESFIKPVAVHTNQLIDYGIEPGDLIFVEDRLPQEGDLSAAKDLRSQYVFFGYLKTDHNCSSLQL